MRWICVIKTKLNKEYDMHERIGNKGKVKNVKNPKQLGLKLALGLVQSYTIKESCGSDGESPCLTRYQKVLGLIPSQILDFFSLPLFLTLSCLHIIINAAYNQIKNIKLVFT